MIDITLFFWAGLHGYFYVVITGLFKILFPLENDFPDYHESMRLKAISRKVNGFLLISLIAVTIFVLRYVVAHYSVSFVWGYVGVFILSKIFFRWLFSHRHKKSKSNSTNT